MIQTGHSKVSPTFTGTATSSVSMLEHWLFCKNQKNIVFRSSLLITHKSIKYPFLQQSFELVNQLPIQLLRSLVWLIATVNVRSLFEVDCLIKGQRTMHNKSSVYICKKKKKKSPIRVTWPHSMERILQSSMLATPTLVLRLFWPLNWIFPSCGY